MPIPASTELTQFLYISCRKIITALNSFGALSVGARGHITPTRRHCFPPSDDRVNLSLNVDVNLTGREVAAQWYAEVKNYDFKRHAGSNTGLFPLLLLKRFFSTVLTHRSRHTVALPILLNC